MKRSHQADERALDEDDAPTRFFASGVVASDATVYDVDVRDPDVVLEDSESLEGKAIFTQSILQRPDGRRLDESSIMAAAEPLDIDAFPPPPVDPMAPVLAPVSGALTEPLSVILTAHAPMRRAERPRRSAIQLRVSHLVGAAVVFLTLALTSSLLYIYFR